MRRQTLSRAAHEIRPDWKRDPRSGTAGADTCRLVVTDPHPSDDRGVEANEPGIVIIVGRSRLAADGTMYTKRARWCAGAAIDDILEHRQHLKRNLWCEYLLGLDIGAMQQVAVGVMNLNKAARAHTIAERRKDGIGRRQFERRDQTAAKCQRRDIRLI